MPRNVAFDLREVKRLEYDLDKLAHKALPYAVKDALNATAFEGRKVWHKAMQREFTIRNKYTLRSVRIDKATVGGRIDSMESVLGSTADYMASQELGTREYGKTASKPIPTRAAAGQSGAGERTKRVQRSKMLQTIKVAKRARYGPRKQRNAIAIGRAVRGNKFAIIETKHGDAIVRVTGRKRVKLRMVWNLFNRSVPVPKSPTLQRTLRVMERRMPGIAVEALKKQLDRQRLFRSR